MKSKIKYSLTAILLITICVVQIQIPGIWNLPQLLNNLRSKLMCSCLYVEGVDLKYCREQAKYNYPYFGERIDNHQKLIQYDLLGLYPSVTQYNEETGCQFIDVKALE